MTNPDSKEKESPNLFLEKLAELEHEQWMQWSKTIYERLTEAFRNGKSLDSVIVDSITRWKPNWIPYSELDESTKDFDREWARKVLEIIDSDCIPVTKVIARIKELEVEKEDSKNRNYLIGEDYDNYIAQINMAITNLEDLLPKPKDKECGGPK